MQRNATRPNIVVITGGKGVAAHASARLLCKFADALELRQSLSDAMAPTRDEAMTRANCSSIWPSPSPMGPPPSGI